MQRNALTEEKKGILIKSVFFMTTLFIIGICYFQSKLVIDALYFILVFILFIRFLIIKLYQ